MLVEPKAGCELGGLVAEIHDMFREILVGK